MSFALKHPCLIPASFPIDIAMPSYRFEEKTYEKAFFLLNCLPKIYEPINNIFLQNEFKRLK